MFLFLLLFFAGLLFGLFLFGFLFAVCDVFVRCSCLWPCECVCVLSFVCCYLCFLFNVILFVGSFVGVLLVGCCCVLFCRFCCLLCRLFWLLFGLVLLFGVCCLLFVVVCCLLLLLVLWDWDLLCETQMCLSNGLHTSRPMAAPAGEKWGSRPGCVTPPPQVIEILTSHKVKAIEAGHTSPHSCHGGHVPVAPTSWWHRHGRHQMLVMQILTNPVIL